MRSRNSSKARLLARRMRPSSSLASVGQSSGGVSHGQPLASRAPSARIEQPMQSLSFHDTSGEKLRFSGLQHQGHRNGQPLRKATVRMPPPSCSEYRCTLVTHCVNVSTMSSSHHFAFAHSATARNRPPRSPTARPFHQPRARLQHVLAAVDDVVLDRLRELHEHGTVAGHAHHEVLVLLGVGLRVEQRGTVHHVELDVLDAQP